jgi:PIN domain nuclease of toxin-antitoxin system
VRHGEPVLLDTHAILWWKAGGDRLSAPAADRISAASAVLISPLSCWEIAMLVRKKRIRLDRPTQTWTVDVLAADNVDIEPLTASIAVAGTELTDFHGDPVDRILVATAAARRVALVTKDRLIHDYARSTDEVDAVW